MGLQLFLARLEASFFYSERLYDATLLRYGLLQVRDEPCDLIQVGASSFSSACELEARDFGGSSESDCVIPLPFACSCDPSVLCCGRCWRELDDRYGLPRAPGGRGVLPGGRHGH